MPLSFGRHLKPKRSLSFQSAVHSLYHAVCLRVVGRTSKPMKTNNIRKVIKLFAIKLLIFTCTNNTQLCRIEAKVETKKTLVLNKLIERMDASC